MRRRPIALLCFLLLGLGGCGGGGDEVASPETATAPTPAQSREASSSPGSATPARPVRGKSTKSERVARVLPPQVAKRLERRLTESGAAPNLDRPIVIKQGEVVRRPVAGGGFSKAEGRTRQANPQDRPQSDSKTSP